MFQIYKDSSLRGSSLSRPYPDIHKYPALPAARLKNCHFPALIVSLEGGFSPLSPPDLQSQVLLALNKKLLLNYRISSPIS